MIKIERKLIMKGYKGFEKGLICREKQYTENTVFEEENAKICESGMHFCKNPFDVWRFYPPCCRNGELNDFAEVEALDEAKTDDNIKFCTSKLKIGKKLTFTDFINAGIKAVLNNAKSNKATNTGYSSAATNTGDFSAATNTGDCSVATNTGDCSVATNTGDCSVATVEGKNSVAIVTGYNSKAKGVKGSWIVCTERDKNYNILCVKATEIDGEKIKENTFYTLKNGQFVKAEENNQ
jgi:hypothetical protein